MNVFTGAGRLTADPRVATPNGKKVANFTIAVNGVKKEDTIFIDVAAWGEKADLCEKYLQKATLIGFSGPIHLKAGADGTMRITLRNLDSITFLGGTKQNA